MLILKFTLKSKKKKIIIKRCVVMIELNFLMNDYCVIGTLSPTIIKMLNNRYKIEIILGII